MLKIVENDTMYLWYGSAQTNYNSVESTPKIPSTEQLLTYRTVSSTFASNRMVHEMFADPPRPNINTLDGERNMPRDATFDLFRFSRCWADVKVCVVCMEREK